MRLLSVLVGAGALVWIPLVAAEGSDPVLGRAALEKRLGEAEAAKDWERALGVAAEIRERIRQEEAEILLRMARASALLGRGGEACDALEKAQEAGYLDAHALRKDEAFASLREDKRFQAVSKAIWLKGYLWLLERPERDDYQKPAEVIAALAFRQGERVADVGAGSGYFARRIARAVGPTGSVLAVDISADLLDYLAGRARREGLANLRVQQVEKDDPRLQPGSVDTILMVDTLHYVGDKAAYAKKLRGGLAPGGRVVIIDFVPKSPEERPWGPPPEQRMSREEVDEAMAAAGLFPSRVHGFLTEQFFVEYRPR